MSHSLLQRFIESNYFNDDPSLSVLYLSRYAEQVGIHWVLCSKLRQFTYEEIEFFLPQLCHLLISVDSESVALEEFLLDLCEESVSGALLTFWLFQTYLHDLAGNPQSNAFKTCRRIYNKVQHIVFGASEPVGREKIKENILPVTVLSSLIFASVAAPFLPKHAGPLALAQARKPRPTVETISDTPQTQKLARSHTVAGGGSTRQKKSRPRSQVLPPTENPLSPESPTIRTKSSPAIDLTLGSVKNKGSRVASAGPRPSLLSISSEARLSSSSLPDFRNAGISPIPTPPATAGLVSRPSENTYRRHSHNPRPLSPKSLPRNQQIRILRSNYFRSQTQFLSALEDISNRLVIVPKPARLSALRAELALIAQDLPAEVDIPLICPATLVDGVAAHSKHHRIVRLNPAEATSLNSAERVPYLLMVEVLRDDFDFDPDSESNQRLLSKLLLEKGATRRRLFDLTDAARQIIPELPADPGIDSVFEPANGDLGNTSLLQDPPEEEDGHSLSRTVLANNGKSSAPRSSSGANTMSSIASASTPRTSDIDTSRANSPIPRKMTLPLSNKTQGPDQPDFSALATHMRTAAQMLAQLETSGSKRPRNEVASIKAKIIASMQSLEEQSFYVDEVTNAPTFDSIMADAKHTATVTAEPEEFDNGMSDVPNPALNASAGAARMENDQKTGGVQRRGDRDDPSAATFGEEWTAKKERIRRSSPYGWMKNWDLISVIVKTGADLRQEAFACQLIQVCSKIWQDAGIPVWVKCMRFLVTGESSGLIETITNGVSLHSLKRSLTLASIAAGTNPRKRIATLRDHFLKTFGEPDSETYAAGVDAFARSLAAYSIICYVLQLKDRHNGNILIDNAGHIIHIDFGFMLSNSPGSMGFEAAPFKLTQEYVDVLGGVGSPAYLHFVDLCKQAFQALRKEAERIVMLVEMMGKESRMPCFAAGVQQAVAALRARFMLQLSKEEAQGFVEDLVAKSVGSYYTRLYDTFQYRTQGIY
ncbi:phosphatidylinositol 4-kinase-like protein PIK1 [Saccharata proteae CBS 121410]|uniref:1-phosphatidylinositol 4-kinase n=1 Tax=Saccharata proteae CBS 121410 TaxID=1314787 RepID=A0A9P4HU22_9PEZI|nr:phosphatidylinositol 4-kinase-like protein PIK1 [Saccharata proteae CBS 121410]